MTNRCLFLFALLLAFHPSVVCAQTKRPNIVLIIADDLGLDLGVYGKKGMRTPNLDKLARRGVLFKRAYATVASCSPSRASILTGLFTHQNGQYGLAHAAHHQVMHEWVQGLPNLLSRSGYLTGIIGKFHVIPTKNFGFDLELTKVNARSPQAMANQAQAFLKKRDTKPFFLVMGYTDPHRAKVGFGNEDFTKDKDEVKYDPKKVELPAFLPDRPETRQDYAEYCQSVSRMDRGVGELLRVLQEAGVLDETIILFISDNGIPFPGAKTTQYEAGLHLPLLVAGPGVPSGRTNEALVSYVDLAPTCLDWAGAKGPASYKLPGKSLRPILDDDNPKGWDEVFGSHQFHEITMYYPMRSLTTKTHKYIVNLDHAKEFPLPSDLWASPTWQSVRKNSLEYMGGRRVFTFLKRPREELYDLTKDADCFKNLAADEGHAKLLGEMRARLRQWQRDTSDPWQILYREEDAGFNK